MRILVKVVLAVILLASVSSAQDVEALFNKGLESLRAERYEECIKDFKLLNSKRADIPQAHYNLGSCYANLNRHSEAIVSYRQAIRLKSLIHSSYRSVS